MSDQVMEQAVRASRGQGMSSIKEVVSAWGDVARFLRGGDSGSLVPVVIPKDKRGLRWTALIWFAVWALISGIILATTGGDAAVAGVPLEEHARAHPDLGRALEMTA